jgi:hypothetical protein
MARVGESASIAPVYGFGLTVRLVGSEEVAKAFAEWGGKVRLSLRRAVQDLAQEARVRLHTSAPSRTGFLRSKIGIRYRESATYVGASIFPQGKAYARGLLAEVGYSGRFWVRPVHGYARVRVEGPTKLGGRAPTKKVRVADTRSGHWRTVRQPPRPWVAPVAEAMRPRVLSALTAAVQTGLE